MSARSAVKSSSNACYCPSCQRVFRTAPANYVCPADSTPVIGVGDPIPAGIGRSILSVGLTLTLLIAVGFSIQLV